MPLKGFGRKPCRHATRHKRRTMFTAGIHGTTAFDSPGSSIFPLQSPSPHISAHTGNQQSHYDNDGAPEWEICRVSNVKLSPPGPHFPNKSVPL